MSKQTNPSIVFARGLWADGSCFSKLIPTLRVEDLPWRPAGPTLAIPVLFGLECCSSR